MINISNLMSILVMIISWLTLVQLLMPTAFALAQASAAMAGWKPIQSLPAEQNALQLFSIQK